MIRLLPLLMGPLMMLGVKDNPVRFHGVAKVTVQAGPTDFVECLAGMRVEDLGSGTPPYKNIFHVILQTACKLPLQEAAYMNVTASAEDGWLLVTAGDWRLECYPMDEEMRSWMAKNHQKPVHRETYWQQVTISRTATGYEYMVKEWF